MKHPITKVCLGLGDIVLDGDQAPPRKGAQQPPLFGLLLSPASPQARILPITRIVESTRQCAAGGYRGNPTGIATHLVLSACYL